MTTDFVLDSLFEKVNDPISKQPPIESEKEEKGHTKCPHHFGYLSQLPKNISFPEECLLCSRVVECIVPS